MMRKLLLIALLAAHLPLMAQSIDDVSRAIALGTPELAAATASDEAQIAALRAENLLEPLEVEVGQLWGTKATGNKFAFGVSQSFDWPGAYTARRSATDATANAMMVARQTIIVDKALEVKLAILDLICLRQQIALYKQVQANVDSLKVVSDLARQRGENTILDVNRLRVEALDIERSLSDMQMRYQETMATINAIGGQDCASLLTGFNEFPEMPLYSEAQYQTMIDRDPALLALHLQARASLKTAEAARLARLPGFSLGYSMNYEDGHAWNGLTASVRLPQFGPRYQEAEQTATAAAQNATFDNERMKMIAQMHARRENVVQLQRTIDQYAEALDGHDNAAMLRRALDAGVITIQTYLQDLNFFLQARVQYIEVRHELATLLAQLNRLDLLD